MKVLMINGSPRENGNTSLALDEIGKVFTNHGVEFEKVTVGKMDIRGCIACRGCEKAGKCVFDDIANELAEKLDQADGLVIGSPVYFASANGTLKSLLHRMFFSSQARELRMKVGACVVVSRRGGSSSTYDELNKFFGIAGMPIATSQYWNMVYGREEGEAARDEEGMQTMRTLAENMVFLMNSIALGKKEYGLPEKEEPVATHFIR